MRADRGSYRRRRDRGGGSRGRRRCVGHRECPDRTRGDGRSPLGRRGLEGCPILLRLHRDRRSSRRDRGRHDGGSGCRNLWCWGGCRTVGSRLPQRRTSPRGSGSGSQRGRLRPRQARGRRLDALRLIHPVAPVGHRVWRTRNAGRRCCRFRRVLRDDRPRRIRSGYRSDRRDRCRGLRRQRKHVRGRDHHGDRLSIGAHTRVRHRLGCPPVRERATLNHRLR